VTHGLLNKGAGDVLRNAPIDRIVLTDSVELPPIESSKIEDRLHVVSVTGIFAEAVGRCHTGGSIVQLLNEGD
jgi:ribose-phosphate pyrophosphokinase